MLKDENKIDNEIQKLGPSEIIQTISSEIASVQKASKTKDSAEKESRLSSCPEAFGYLANRPKDEVVSQKCLVCPKMVDCMLSPRED